MMMKKGKIMRWSIGSLAGMALLALVSVAERNQKADQDYRMVYMGDATYRLPKEYFILGSSGEKDSLFLQVSSKDGSPLLQSRPGWNGKINILVTHGFLAPSFMYSSNFSKNPDHINENFNRIVNEYKTTPDLTVQEMSGGFHIVVPDQKMPEMERGFMLCDIKQGIVKTPGCSYYFHHHNHNWKISFGREFISQYKNIQNIAINSLIKHEIIGAK